jgi:hypothetical protein
MIHADACNDAALIADAPATFRRLRGIAVMKAATHAVQEDRKMTTFSKIVAGLGALLITATTLGLPKVAGYCIARTPSTRATPVFASGIQPLVSGKGAAVWAAPDSAA